MVCLPFQPTNSLFPEIKSIGLRAFRHLQLSLCGLRERDWTPVLVVAVRVRRCVVGVAWLISSVKVRRSSSLPVYILTTYLKACEGPVS